VTYEKCLSHVVLPMLVEEMTYSTPPSILISLVFDDQNPFHCVHTKPFIPCPVTVE